MKRCVTRGALSPLFKILASLTLYCVTPNTCELVVEATKPETFVLFLQSASISLSLFLSLSVSYNLLISPPSNIVTVKSNWAKEKAWTISNLQSAHLPLVQTFSVSLQHVTVNVAPVWYYNLSFTLDLSSHSHPLGGVTSGPGVTVPNVPNPGSDGGTFEITIMQSWSQETDYARVTQVNNFGWKHFAKKKI